MSKTVIGLDFDGVLNSYTSGYTEDLPDPPVEGAVEFVNWLLENNVEVYVFTARVRDGQTGDAAKIREWLEKWGFPRHLLITNRKLPSSLYVDDRGWRFDGSFEKLYQFLDQENFRPGTWGEEGWRLTKKSK